MRLTHFHTTRLLVRSGASQLHHTTYKLTTRLLVRSGASHNFTTRLVVSTIRNHGTQKSHIAFLSSVVPLLHTTLLGSQRRITTSPHHIQTHNTTIGSQRRITHSSAFTSLSQLLHQHHALPMSVHHGVYPCDALLHVQSTWRCTSRGIPRDTTHNSSWVRYAQTPTTSQ